MPVTQFVLSGSLNVKLRPLRLAFIVAPNDAGALLAAIQTTSFLWGGRFNPIIPYYRRLPNGWTQHPGGTGSKASAVVDGYLEAFDPDFVVTVGSLETADLQFGHRTVVKCSEILEPAIRDGAPTLGIGLFEIFQGFAEQELKFVRSQPIPFCAPELSGQDSLFFASLFGALSPPIMAEFDRALPGYPGLSRVGCAGSEYLDRIEAVTLSPRRLGAWKIRVSRDQSHEDCVFLMDSRNVADIVDLWNLRAVGWNVVPVCRHLAANPGVLRSVAAFVNRNFFPSRGNPDFYHKTLLLPSRNVLISEATHFANSLELEPSPKPHQHPIVLCPYYPRIWDTWAREKDGVLPCRLEVSESEVQLAAGEDRIRFPSLIPEFASRFAGLGAGPRCANEIALRIWGHDRPFAEVIPEGGEDLVRAITNYSVGDWRCGGSGPVFLPRYKNWIEPVPLTGADQVFIAWLKERGWEAEISDKGHIALQMFRQLGGNQGLSILAVEGMVEFLVQLARQGTIKVQQFFGALKRLTNLPGNRFSDAGRLAKRLVANQMVQLGIEVQCPRCRQRSWYSVTDARYELKCTKCLSDFPLPSHSPRDIACSYRAIGPFSLPSIGQSNAPNQAHGSLTVLLALRFFVQLNHGATTPLFSFTAKKATRVLEVDLGLLFQESKRTGCRIEQLFCECKSFNTFEEDDARRMRQLGSEFPGAFLVFATLNKSLSQKEKRILRPIVNRGRKYWKNERPFNPVLILTGNELFAELSINATWRELGGIHARRADRWNENRLLELADATQEIYLEMPTWHVWLHEQSQKKRRRRLAALSGSIASSSAVEAKPTPTTSFPIQGRQVPFL